MDESGDGIGSRSLADYSNVYCAGFAADLHEEGHDARAPTLGETVEVWVPVETRRAPAHRRRYATGSRSR